MYEPYRDQGEFTVSINWDRNTAIGFTYTLIATAVLLLIFTWVRAPEKTWAKELRSKSEFASWEISEISFGIGDGTGGNHGNLAKEGKSGKGRKPHDMLENGQRKSQKGKENKSVDTNPEDLANITPASASSNNGVRGDETSGTGDQNVGGPNGSKNGRGVGKIGTGRGAGLGYGKIDWGGGGNRIVSYKPPKPKFPDGVNIRKARIRIKFWVDANGSVIRAIALQKADPRLDRLALGYIKRFKFNPLEDDKVMYGVIDIIWKIT